MMPELFLHHAIIPALHLLPVKMDSVEARALVLAIATQESRLRHRTQIHGPARGYAQFERVGIQGVLTHPSSRRPAAELCALLDIEPTVADVYDAIAYQDVLCAGFARLLLWTLPDALPGPTEPGEAYEVYLEAWRPGKPHPEVWMPNYEAAWRVVMGRDVPKAQRV